MLSVFNFSRTAEKSFRKLQRTNAGDSKAIWLRLESLLENPLPPQSVRLSGHSKEIYRIRVGAYRVIYAIDGATLHIGIVARRNQAYKQFATLIKSGTWPPAAE